MVTRIKQALRKYPTIISTIKTTTKTYFPFNFYIANKQQKTQLGRWGNHYDNKTNIKTDYSNIDHCGPCGLDKINNIK